MLRKIEDLPEDDTGLCYDLHRAQVEGLFEEVVAFSVSAGSYGNPMNATVFERHLDSRAMEALDTLFPDLFANMAPGEVGHMHVIFNFRYGYSENVNGDHVKIDDLFS